MDQTRPEARSGKPREWDTPFHIVGVAASAGGLEALEKFFDNMRRTAGWPSWSSSICRPTSRA